MERNSSLEHLRDLAMPRKRMGLMKMTTKAPLTRKQLDAAKRMDDRKDSSLRKPNEVPGSASKSRSHRQ
jgi:hypothetical protein